jgi:hypothetical protein
MIEVPIDYQEIIMSTITFNRSDLEREYWSQIWGYIQPHQTICYDPNPPLYFPPSAQVKEVLYAIH